jgi:hypothetical protein
MNNWKKYIACGALLAVLFITSCGEGSGDSNTFPHDLHGTWVIYDGDPDYDGELEIRSNRITIWGFSRDQTQWYGYDEDRPFRAFTKDVALKGYAEDGKIFIEDKGLVQEGIPYTFYKTPDYPRTYFLYFTFGYNDVTFRKE